MSELKGGGGVLRATIHITRKSTGKVETVELVGHTDPEKLAELLAEVKKEKPDGRNT